MPELSRILVIAPHGSYRTSAFITAGHRQGVKVLLVSEGEHSIVSDYARGLHVDFSDQAAALALILREAAKEPVAGIIATDDITTELAARAAQRLGLSHNSPTAVQLARRKDLARACLAAAQIPVPRHWCLDLGQPLSTQVEEIGYPAVVKPVGLSGSRGVIRVNSSTELHQAVKRVQAMLQQEVHLDPDVSRVLLVETYVPGMEVAVEGMLTAGQLQLLTVFDKPDPMEGPYFEETYYTMPSRHGPEVLAALQNTIQAACDAYGLREGPVHAECRVNDDGIWILEVAARTIGGLCGRLLQFGTGYSLEELVLAQAIGNQLPMEIGQQGGGVLMIPIPQAGILKRVEGILAAQRIPYIESIEIQIREGHELVPLPEGSSYLGFIFARAPTAALAEAALRAAHACLNIVVAPLWKANVA
jgi:biotin carboxylase